MANDVAGSPSGQLDGASRTRTGDLLAAIRWSGDPSRGLIPALELAAWRAVCRQRYRSILSDPGRSVPIRAMLPSLTATSQSHGKQHVR
jgi:hypothetical protein